MWPCWELLPSLKGLVSDILPARSSHTDLTTEFKNATAATTIKNANKENKQAGEQE